MPYHAHSDFIQLGAELGIIGFYLFWSFFSAVIMCFKLIISKTLPVKTMKDIYFHVNCFHCLFMLLMQI